MKNKNYRMERRGKIFLLLPLVFVSFCLFSCAVKSVPELTHNEIPQKSAPTDNKVHSTVEAIPNILGEDVVMGYPSSILTLSAGGNTLVERYMEGFQIKPQNHVLGGTKSEIGYVIGYPTRPKIILAPTPDEVILLMKK